MEAHASPFDASMIGWADAYIRNDVPGQVRALQRALEYSPNNNILLYALARGRYMLDDYQAALESINDALTMRWAFSPAYYLAGLCQYRLGHFKEAKEVLSRALVFEPVFRDIYGMLSLIAMSEGDTVESLRHEFLYLRRSVELGHTAHAANASLGRLSNTYGSAVNAARLYRRAITLEGTIGAYHVGLGESLLAMGRIDDALLESRLGLRLDSTQGRAYFTIARAFDTQGDSLHAARYYQSFLRFDSTSGDALTAHQRLLMILPPPEH
jgi:tetratricopeptide (TPR) repeat protein